MPTHARTLSCLVTFVALLAACGSGGTGAGGSATTTTPSSSSGTTTTSSHTTTTSGTTTTTGDGGTSCDEMCISMYPTAFPKFEAYELKECGCTAGAACTSMCNATDCAATMMSQVSTTCQTCLTNEAAKGLGSSCTIKAAETDCAGDASCKAFSSCGVCCATTQKPC